MLRKPANSSAEVSCSSSCSISEDGDDDADDSDDDAGGESESSDEEMGSGEQPSVKEKDMDNIDGISGWLRQVRGRRGGGVLISKSTLPLSVQLNSEPSFHKYVVPMLRYAGGPNFQFYTHYQQS